APGSPARGAPQAIAALKRLASRAGRDHMWRTSRATSGARMLKRLAALSLTAAAALTLAACGNNNNDVGSVGVDWTGNDIAIEAVADPEVDGVVCHVAFFNRSFIDRLQQGNWFEDPSYSAVDCSAFGPITIGDINMNK